MFHSKEGLFFERLPHGDVRIVKTADEKMPSFSRDNILFETTLGASTVASIMAASSCRGYTTDTFYEAYEYLKCPTRPYDTPNPPKEVVHGDK